METDPSATSNIFAQLLLVAILTLINAFFASAEMAIVSVNKHKLKLLANDGNKKAQLLLNFTEDPSKLLATIQVGITLAGFFSSASAATGISTHLSKILKSINIPYSDQISLIGITIILSYITLVFGELYPKRIALRNAESLAMFSVKPIMIVSTIASPFVKFLSLSTNLLVKITGIEKNAPEDSVSREELLSFVEVGQEQGVINETEMDMINSIIEFDDKMAKEIITPSTETFSIDINIPIKEFIDKLLEEQYSRIPVYSKEIDNIIGVVYLKDIFEAAYHYGFDKIDLRKIMRKPYFVPETKNIDVLFKELQDSKQHMSILVDEYGGFSGIVTIEDIIEEVMGNIDDEFDIENNYFSKIDNNTFIVDGLLSLVDLNNYLDINVKSDISDTVGGFLINEIGGIPKPNEDITIEYNNVIFKVEEVDEKRIKKIRISI